MKNSNKFFSVLTLIIFLSGCGQEAIRVGIGENEQSAAGLLAVPPKVDVILATDDSGSITSAYGEIDTQVRGFLQSLDAEKWDYRFATVKLTQERSITQIAASRYDGNWTTIGGWIPPFPGADPFGFVNGNYTRVNPTYFRTASNYSHFLNSGDINYAAGAQEPGLEMIRRGLHSQRPPYTTDAGLNSGSAIYRMLRQDALTVVLAVSNGEDTSGVTLCPQYPGVPGGPMAPCEQVPYDGCSAEDCTSASSFEYYTTQFAKNKGDSNKLRFYSAVAANTQSNCLGSNSRRGNRYIQMSSHFNGRSYDVCSTPINAVLDDMRGHLTDQILKMRRVILKIDYPPQVDSIRVLKHTADGTFIVPPSATNGWTYLGKTTEYSVDYPAEMNLVTGYLIRLNGVARLIGNETATVEASPEGVQNGS